MATTSTTLKFVLLADTATFNAQMRNVQATLTGTAGKLTAVGVEGEKATNKVTTGAGRMHNILTRAQSVATSVAISLAVIAAMNVFGKIIRAGLDFELAFTGIKKTVTATEDQFAQLEQTIRQMGKTLPFTASELSRVGQIAGQMGIAAEDIAAFTKVVMDLSIAADDLNFEQASFSLARLSKIMGTPIDEANKMSSAIVALGNNFATTEGEIVEMALRLGAAGRVIGLTSPQVLALSATMTQLGIRAQVGGSSISRAMIEMRKAVDTGSERLALFAKVAGISVDEFVKLFRSDAAQAITLFIEGLGSMVESGGPVFAMLEDLGLADLRVTRAMLSAAAASEEQARAQKVAEKAFKEGTASQKEAQKFYETTIERLKTLGGKYLDLAITITESLSPAIESAIGFFTDLHKELENYGVINKYTVTLIALFAVFKATVIMQTVDAILVWVATTWTAVTAARGFTAALVTLNAALASTLPGILVLVAAWAGPKIYAAIRGLAELGKQQQEVIEITREYIPLVIATQEKLKEMGIVVEQYANESLVQYYHRLKDALDAASELKEEQEKLNNVIKTGIGIKGLTVKTEGIERVVSQWEQLAEALSHVEDKATQINLTIDGFIKEAAGAVRSGTPLIKFLQEHEESLAALIDRYEVLGEELPSNVDLLREWMEMLKKAKTETKGLTEEQQKLLDKFNEQLRPLEAIVKEYREYAEVGVSMNNFVKVNKDRLIEARRVQEEYGQAVSETGKQLSNLAGTLQMLDDVITNSSNIMSEQQLELQRGFLETQEMLSGITSEAIKNRDALDENGKMTAYLSLLKQRAAWNEKDYGTALEQTIAYLEAMADAEGEVGQVTRDISQIMKRQFSTILTDLGRNFADIITKWEGLWQSLKKIALDFANSILRIFFENLFSPIMNGIANLMSGGKGGFMGGFKGAGGTTTMLGALGGLGKIFGIGGGSVATKALPIMTGSMGGVPELAGAMGTVLEGPPAALAGGGGVTGFFTSIGTAATTAASSIWSLLTTMTALGPVGGIIAGVAAAAYGLYKIFKKSTTEKVVEEFARDFGGVKIAESQVNDLYNALGITEKQAEDIRKDLSSSPIFLQIGYDAAKAQGKTETFLSSLENIQTAWGTFNFREEFERGINTGAWDDLNQVFIEAFGNSEQLVKVFGSDLSPLLAEIDEELEVQLDRWEALDTVLAELRGKPEAVAKDLDIMVDSLEHLQTAGATNDEIIQILGEDLITLVDAAKKLGVEIPQLVLDMYALAKAGSDTAESVEELNTALKDGKEAALDFLTSGQDLADYIVGYGQALLDAGIPATKAQIIAWDQLGDKAINLYNDYIKLGLPIPEIIQMVVNWGVANGKLALSFDKTASAIEDFNDAVSEGAKGWADFKNTGIDFAHYVKDFILAAWEDLDMASKSTAEQFEFQKWAWEEFGDTFIENANKIIRSPLGPAGLDWYTKLVMDWAESFGFVTKELNGTYKAIDDIADAGKKVKDVGVFSGIDKTVPIPVSLRDPAIFRDMANKLVAATGATGIGNMTLHRRLQDAWENFYRMGMGGMSEFESLVFGPVAELMKSGQFRFFSDAFKSVLEESSSGVVEEAVRNDIDRTNTYLEENPIRAKVEIDLDASLTQDTIERFVFERIIPEINRQLATRRAIMGSMGPARPTSTTTTTTRTRTTGLTR